MKLKLQGWGNIADIISGAAIVITLIFLILEVRENTEVSRVGAYDRNMDSLNSVRAVVTSDAKMADNYLAVDRGQWAELSPDENLRIRVFFEMLFGVYEKTYFAKKFGHIGESEWERFERHVCLQRKRVSGNEGLLEAMQVVMTEEFFDYMNEKCTSKKAAK